MADIHVGDMLSYARVIGVTDEPAVMARTYRVRKTCCGVEADLSRTQAIALRSSNTYQCIECKRAESRQRRVARGYKPRVWR